jgi:hypothetical protein
MQGEDVGNAGNNVGHVGQAVELQVRIWLKPQIGGK